jgi:hypothetical protein
MAVPDWHQVKTGRTQTRLAALAGSAFNQK